MFTNLHKSRRCSPCTLTVVSLALSDADIEDMMRSKMILIDPFDRKGLNPAGYDLRSDETFELAPGKRRLVATMERLELGVGVMGTLHVRSSLAREGVIAGLALVDPGFRGQLTVSLFNAGKNPVGLRRGEPFLQIAFFALRGNARRGYEGRYQDSSGVVHSRR